MNVFKYFFFIFIVPSSLKSLALFFLEPTTAYQIREENLHKLIIKKCINIISSNMPYPELARSWHRQEPIVNQNTLQTKYTKMTTCEWKEMAICEHCHKSVAYRVITAITCVTWRPNMAVCQVMMDCLTAVHRDNTLPTKHVLTTSRNNNLKTPKKKYWQQKHKKYLVYFWDFDWYKAWELCLFSVLWLFSPHLLL